MKIHLSNIQITKDVANYWSLLHRAQSTCASQQRNKYSVLFYGSDKFSIESLKLLHRNYCLNNDDSNRIIDKIDVVSGVGI